jgi:hypothetical protein
MRACIALFAPVVCVSVALTISFGVLPGSVVEAAPECLTKPGAPPPQGKHWYYTTDRANNRRCWYLGDRGEKVHRPPRFASPEPRVASPEPTAVTPKPRPQRTIEDIVRDLNTEAPAKETAGAAPAADQSLRSGVERVEREATATSGAASEEPAQGEPEQSATVWPKLAAAEPVMSGQALPLVEQPTTSEVQPAATEPSAQAVEPPAESSGGTWYVLMLLFVAFVGAALVYHRASARRVARRLELERKLVAGSEMLEHPSAPATFAAEVGHWADIARRQPLPGDERFRDTEDAVHALLRASRARHHEQAA